MKFSFLECEIDLSIYEVTRGGEQLSIGPRALDLLVFLVQNRHRVVSRDELTSHVWKATALSEATIPTTIMEIRRVLGDDPQDPKVIQTVRGRGYRFLPNVETVATKDDSSKSPEARHPLVGRSGQLSELSTQAASTVREFSGRTAILVGEPGSGKSRLLHEFEQRAPREYLTMTAQASNAPTSTDLAVWRTLTEGLLAKRKHKTSPRVATPPLLSASQLGLLHADRAPDAAQPPPLNRWTQALIEISRTTPLLILIDDIDRADIASLHLLNRLASAITFVPIFIVATCRPYCQNTETTHLIATTLSYRRSKRLDLNPLSQEEILELLPESLRGNQGLSHRIEDKTGGNPYFVVQLIQKLQHQTRTTATELALASIPASPALLVEKILYDLPDCTRKTLATASTQGDSFSVELLAAASGRAIEAELESLEPAIAGGHVHDEGNCFRFAHSIMRDALYGLLSSRQKRSIHQRTASAIAGLPTLRQNSALLAEHLRSAYPLSSAADVAASCYDAGIQLCANSYFHKALSFLESASAFSQQCDSLPDLQKFKIAKAHARALFGVGRREEARNLLLELCERILLADLQDELPEAVLSLFPDFEQIAVGIYDLSLVRMLEEAIAHTSMSNKATQALLHAALSQSMLWSSTPDQCLAIAQNAVGLARMSGDKECISKSLLALAEATRGPDRTLDRLQLLREASEITPLSRDALTTLLHHTRMISAYLELGDIRSVDAENRAARELAERIGLPHLLWYPESMDSLRALMRGDLSNSDRIRSRYEEIRSTMEISNIEQGFATQEFFIQAETGRADTALPALRRMALKHPNVLGWRAAVAWMTLNSGSCSDAVAELDAFKEIDVELLFRDPGGGIGIALLSEVAAKVGTESLKRSLYDFVTSATSRAATAGYAALYFGTYSRWAGLLARSLGRMDAAVRHAREAIELENERDAFLWKAYAQVDLANALRDAGVSTEQVRHATEEAKRSTERIGLSRLRLYCSESIRETFGR